MVESGVHRLLGLYKDNLDRLIVPSRFYGQKLAEWGWPRDKLVYIPNYVDAENYQPQFTPAITSCTLAGWLRRKASIR
jgi:glycosyltransferase involved in cell wall biosynthesis